jgi:uncharacterized protein (TIGR02284 family)
MERDQLITCSILFGGYMDKDKKIVLLNSLIEICKDGQEGFKQAADSSINLELKQFFLETSEERSRMARDLQAEVLRLGGAPENQGSVAGALHRTWIDLKGTVSFSDQSILEATEKGEDSAIEEYEKALNEDLPPEFNKMIKRQYSSIMTVHDRIRVLRDSGAFKTHSA